MNQNSYQDSFLDDLGTWANENQTITDPFLTDLGRTTLNSYYTPIKTIRNDSRALNQPLFISTPPGYLPCKIDLYYGGSFYKTIPVLFPETISEQLSTNFIKESPVGSTYPITAFSNAQPTTVPVTFFALADYLPSGYTSLRSYLNDLKLMCKPRYSGNIVYSPSVRVTFSDISFYAVCDSLTIDYDQVYNNRSLVKANVSCQFTITESV